MLALLIVGLIALYLAGAGTAFIYTYRYTIERTCDGCKGIKTTYYGYTHLSHDHFAAGWAGAFSGLLWPAAIFVLLPAILLDPHRSHLKQQALQRRIAQLEREADIR